MPNNNQKSDNQTINLKKVYSQIKKRCLFQKFFSTYLLCIFFVLQYSVPIFLVVLGNVTISRDQLRSFVEKDVLSPANENNSKQTELKLESDIIVSKIIFVLGIITILLGVINNIIKPAESYDRSAKFNNEFFKFDLELELAIIESGGITELKEEQDFDFIVKLLLQKNQELSKLIDEYNKARSLKTRTAEIELLKQEVDELKNTVNN